MARPKPPTAGGHGRISAPDASPVYTNTLRVVFGFRHIVKQYDLRGGDGNDAGNLIDSLRIRSTMTWAQILQSGRQHLGSEKITAALRVPIPPGVPAAKRDALLSFRFGDNMERFIGYRDGATFEIVWIDHAGECYQH
jgi:hypothetical protein